MSQTTTPLTSSKKKKPGESETLHKKKGEVDVILRYFTSFTMSKSYRCQRIGPRTSYIPFR